MRAFLASAATLLSMVHRVPAPAQESQAEIRARKTGQKMTDDERIGLIRSYMVGVFGKNGGQRDARVPDNVPQIAGWVKGLERLGVPDLLLTDAGLGITNPGHGGPGDQATALPSAQILAATFNPQLAYKSALVAFVAAAEFAGAVLAQDLDASRVTRTGTNEASTKAFPAQTGKPRAEEPTDASMIASHPGSHQAADARVEVIHLPTFSAAGSIETGSKSLRLIGVVITAVDAQCGSGPDAWPCGRMARAALQRFVRGRSVACRMPERPVDATAQCSVGGKDIGRWLVAQGWARADGSGYVDAENTARGEKRGIWSQVRPELAPAPAFEAGPALKDAAVRAEIHLSTQSMILFHRGRIVGQWPVSTARNGKETPTGVWTAKWLSRHHRSHRYDNAPMPYSVFYDGDYAVHGTYQTARLGRPASAGCVRLDPRHAAALYNLVRKEGLSNTLIVIRQ